MCVSGSVATLYARCASWGPSEIVAISLVDPVIRVADWGADGCAAAVSAPISTRLPITGNKDRPVRPRIGQACLLIIAPFQSAGPAEPACHERLTSLGSHQDETRRPRCPGCPVATVTDLYAHRWAAVWVAVHRRTGPSREDRPKTLVQAEPRGTATIRAANAVRVRALPGFKSPSLRSSQALPSPWIHGRGPDL